MSSTTTSSDEELETPPRKQYKRSIHHGLSRRRATRYNATPEKPRSISMLSGKVEKEQYGQQLFENSESDSSSNSDTSFSSTTSCTTDSKTGESSDTAIGSNIYDSPGADDDNENFHGKPLYEGCRHTHYSSYTAVMLFVMKHSLSKEAFSDVLLLLASHLPDSAKFPTSVYKVKETLKSCILFNEPKLHFYCEECQQYSPDGEVCSNAMCRRNNVQLLQFFDLKMVDQLKSMFQDHHFYNMVRRTRNPVQDGMIADITDGERYKEVVSNAGTADVNLTLTMNTYGVSLFSSSKKGSLWPVYVAINELPIKQRFTRRYFIPCYLHCHVEKPNMLTYLSPMMNLLQDLQDTGFEVTTANGTLRVKAQLLAVSLDLPARAMVANMKQFNGKSGCSICYDEGESRPAAPMLRFYPFRTSVMRTHQSMLTDSQNASITGAAVNGVKGASPLVVLRYVDLPKVFAIDWMHGVLLGVTKACMKFWFNSKYKNETFFIGNKLHLLNQRLMSIQIPDFISRRQRSLDDHSHWKASECREWLIHFSAPVLYGILGAVPYVHFLLLVTAMSLLTSDNLTKDDVDYADQLLLDFCKLMPAIYGTYSQTMNVHLLKHLATFSRLYGPLLTVSCFGCESMNSNLKSMVHGTRYNNNQVSFAVIMAKQLTTLIREFTENTVDEKIRNLTSTLGAKFMQEETQESDHIQVLGKKKRYTPTEDSFDLLSHDMISALPMKVMRIRMLGSTYHSKDNQSAKTKNSYTVGFEVGGVMSYGMVQTYIEVNNQVFAIIHVCEAAAFSLGNDLKAAVDDPCLRKYFDILCPHIHCVKICDTKRLVPVNAPRKKCVFMEISQNLYISEPPNLVEHG